MNKPPRQYVLWKRRKLARALAQAWADYHREPTPLRKLEVVRLETALAQSQEDL